jgi:uncharacterized protein YbjQ (UPF0145 family)
MADLLPMSTTDTLPERATSTVAGSTLVWGEQQTDAALALHSLSNVARQVHAQAVVGVQLTAVHGDGGRVVYRAIGTAVVWKF